MSVTVTPVRLGPDYTGETDIEVHYPISGELALANNGTMIAKLRLSPEQTEQLFAKVGQARKVEIANADPA